MEEERRQISLDPDRMKDKYLMSAYFEELFDFPGHFGRNLDALADCMSEVSEDCDIILTRDSVRSICRNKYSYKVLMVLSRCVDENPHLRILFR